MNGDEVGLWDWFTYIGTAVGGVFGGIGAAIGYKHKKEPVEGEDVTREEFDRFRDSLLEKLEKLSEKLDKNGERIHARLDKVSERLAHLEGFSDAKKAKE